MTVFWKFPASLPTFMELMLMLTLTPTQSKPASVGSWTEILKSMKSIQGKGFSVPPLLPSSQPELGILRAHARPRLSQGCRSYRPKFTYKCAALCCLVAMCVCVCVFRGLGVGLKGQDLSIGTRTKIVFSVVSNYKWWVPGLINPFLSALGRLVAPE